MKTTIKCPRCDGKGEIKLSEEMLETLLCFRGSGLRGDGTFKAGEIEDILRKTTQLGSSAGVVNNRLELLRSKGLLRRRREARSKQWLYSLANRRNHK